MLKWCTYSFFNRKYPQYLGKLMKQEGNTGWIRYSENQMYSNECWDMDYVETFDNLEDAIVFLIKNNSDENITSLKEYLRFPEMKNVNWEKIKERAY